MVLRSGFIMLAQQLQEAADKISHSNVRDHLRDAVQDAHKGSGRWANYVDHTGDGNEGDVIYSVDGDTMSSPYSIKSSAGKQTATIDKENETKVIPVVNYKKQATATSEADVPRETSGMRLVESAACLETIVIREAKADYEIKLIAPGKGSSAFYPAEVLKRDGPQVFKAGTHVYVNHPTLAEESQRPEGDVKNLAGVLTSDAVYHEAHAKGPGLYGRMKVFADHGQMVEEKAAHVGMSIRASGVAEAGGKRQDGVPILARLTSAESVDVVTRAGAGGMILTEAARRAANPNTGDDMTPEQQNQLREAAKLVLHEGARRVATATLADVSLNEAGKQEAIRRCLEKIPTREGLLDEATFVTAVKEEAKTVGAFMASFGGNPVRGMGVGYGPAPTQLTEAQIEEARKGRERLREAQTDVFTDIMGDKRAGGFAAKGRAA